MRKKIDNRIRILVENAVAKHHRAFFVMIGDRSRDQVMNLHYMLSKITTTRPSVLWCYKKDLGFSSHRKKRMKQLKLKVQKGTWDPNIDDPFELFITSTRIRYCYYKETHTILGQTYGMCILQDFEALTPNLLCRTIETVEGGGLVCILLRSMESLKQLYQLTMDVHSRLSKKTLDEHGAVTDLDVEPRFNERFILSLADCPQCLIVDDELNILPISRHAKRIVSIGSIPEQLPMSKSKNNDITFSLSGVVDTPELKDLKENMKGSPMGALVELSVTMDQAKALLSFIDSIAEKSLNSTLSLTAARGRGKSATLGLSIAAAIAYSYSNVFVTAPSPENIATLFEFVQKGLVALGYKEHTDFELIQGEVPTSSVVSSTSDALGGRDVVPQHSEPSKQLLRINVFREHRQTIQYISPNDIALAKQAEILVIDEAAAIPLPLVSKLFGPYFVFLSSTINGYEGTGRALSLKLLQEIRQGSKSLGSASSPSLSGRTLKELVLQEPIRYSNEDPVEFWLNRLLCLDATTPAELGGNALAPPRQCTLYKVNRDSLFSFHKASEAFLHKMMSLFVSSHYKNSPNDLMLLSDAPAHHLFVLLPPVTEEQSELPDVYVAIQIAIEGAISKEAIRHALSRGLRPSGDLVPWTLSQSFIDEDFGSLNGARIVRIAVHPSLQRMGYGSEAVKQLIKHLQGGGDFLLLDEERAETAIAPNKVASHSYHPESTEQKEEKRPNYSDDIEEESNSDDAKQDNNNSNNHNGSNKNSYSETNEDRKDTAIKPTLDTSKLKTEIIAARDVPPLLRSCNDSPSLFYVEYISTSFGLTLDLLKFHNRMGFQAVYLRQSPNETTGEYSVIMLRALKSIHSRSSDGWVDAFVCDFKNRIVNLLGSCFSHLPINTCLSLILPNQKRRTNDSFDNIDNDVNSLGENPPDMIDREGLPEITYENISEFFSSYDLLRLERCSQQLMERNAINDLLPTISWLLLTNRLPKLSLSFLQIGVILAMGSQRKTVDAIAKEFKVPSNQVLALFNKSVHKLHLHFHSILEQKAQNQDIEETRTKPNLNTEFPKNALPEKSLEEELEEDAKMVKDDIKQKKERLMNEWTTNKMKQYSLSEFGDNDFKSVLSGKKVPTSFSIKSKRNFIQLEDGKLNQGFQIQKTKKPKKK